MTAIASTFATRFGAGLLALAVSAACILSATGPLHTLA